MQPTTDSLSPEEFLQRVLGGSYPPFEANRSPDGKFAVVVAPEEMCMSHWINSAAIWSLETSTMLLMLGQDLWSTDTITWSADHGLQVDMRRYPGDVPGIKVAVDLDKRIVQVTSPTESASISFQQLNVWLEQYYRQHSQNS